jgi:hypothetical protein
MEQRRREADRAASVISGTTGPGPASTPNRRETICIKINAIQVNVAGGVPTPTAQAVMLNYEHTSCGWYSDIPHDGTGIADICRLCAQRHCFRNVSQLYSV